MNEDPGIMPRMTTAEMPGSATFEPLGVGSKVGPYRLARKIGRGGMGVVFEGIHERIGQRAAVKLLLRGEREREMDASAVERFLTEARALSRVEHPGLVRIFDCGETERGTPWISMELLDGQMLRERIERRESRGSGLPVPEAIRTARQLASAVAAIHRAGVIHRDLKPDNVMVVADEEAPGGERVKLLDFGIAKLAGDGTATAEGVVIGTAAYMAPEQCVGSSAIDERADVYALGVVIYEMLAGRRPFVGDPADVMRQHLFAEPPPIDEGAPGLPEGLVALVRAMMAKEPSLRPDLAVAIEDLRALELSFGPPAPRGSRPREGEGDAAAGLDAAPTEPATAADGLRFPRTGPADGFATAPPRGALTEPRPSEKSWAREEGAELANKLETAPPTAEGPSGAPDPSEKPTAPPRRGRGLILGVTAVIALGAAALVATIYPGKKPPAKVALPGMARIEGATFRMGSTDAEIAAACSALPGGCAPEVMPQLQREKPAHDVTVSPFQIDVHEVTNAEYAAFLHVVAALVDVREDKDDHSARFVIERATGMLLIDLHPAFGGVSRSPEGQFVARPGRERWPVSQVTWDGASRYCRQAGKRLPTEAEWELAARGPGSRLFPWGDAVPRCEAVVFGRSPEAGCASLPAEPRDVGTSPQDVSPEGVFDLAGNVGEWVQDQFALAYYPDCGACRDPVSEANVPVAEDMRLLRGGTFRSPAYVGRTTTRSRWRRTDVMDGLGFRCASR